MKLNLNQAEMLQTIQQEGPLPLESSLVHKNIVTNLLSMGLIRCPIYVNGQFLETTDLGNYTLKNLDIKK